MSEGQPNSVNILLVDDQESKLLTYEAILGSLSENLLKARSGQEALQHILKHDIAVAVVDVMMPDIDGFELAAMIHAHPRTENLAIIFVSAVAQTDVDRLKGYQRGAVDYLAVPVVPEVLRAKVRVFADLHRKTRELERLNAELERRVEERTTDLNATNQALRGSVQSLKASEARLQLTLDAARLGTFERDLRRGIGEWSELGAQLHGMPPGQTRYTPERFLQIMHPTDRPKVQAALDSAQARQAPYNVEYRVRQPDGKNRWIAARGEFFFDDAGQPQRAAGICYDITERKQAEQRLKLLAREVDHRARNLLSVVQGVVRLTRAETVPNFKEAVENRISALARAHSLIAANRWRGADLYQLAMDELSAHVGDPVSRFSEAGPEVLLNPAAAQSISVAIHELATNAVKYGALSAPDGQVALRWRWQEDDHRLEVIWVETGGPPVRAPERRGFGSTLIEGSIKRQLGGEVETEWRAEGLRCRFLLPEAAIVVREHEGGDEVPTEY